MDSLQPEVFFDLSSFDHRDLFVNCEYVWQALANIEAFLKNANLGKINATIPENAYIVDKHLITIGEGTIIEPGAYIKGPCIIGRNCSIRHGAYIRGGLIAGDGCVIGHDTEIKNVVLLNKAHAAHFAYVGDSILGNHVNLGAGTVCANLKLDASEVFVRWNNQRITTRFKKFGSIVGDGTQIGCNSVLNPGTLLGKEVRCYPCTNVGGCVPSYAIVKPNTVNSVIVPANKQ